MKDIFSPILEITRWWFTDKRPGMNRQPGAAVSLKNLFPNITGEERTRPGYSQYSSADGGSTPGQDMPTGTELFMVGSIQSPVQDDVHIKFVSSGGQKVYMNPWYQGAARQSTDMQINESINLSGQPVSYPAANQMTLTGAPLAKPDNYFNGCVLQVGTKYALVTAYSGAPNTFTFLEDVNAAGLNLGATVTGTFWRNFHDNPTFSPAYNNDKLNPPTLNCQNSIIRFSGGQGSASGLRPIWINPHLKRTFFPGVSRSFIFEGTYASERELKTQDLLATGTTASGDGGALSNHPVSVGGVGLPLNSTTWLAVAPVYDGYQIGKLTKYETVAAYNGVTMPNNYFDGTAQNSSWWLILGIPSGLLNKRITGFAIYAAEDVGQVFVRKSPYFFVGFLPLTDSNFTGWSYINSGTQQVFKAIFKFDGTAWNGRGNTYQVDSGIVDNSPDTMYANSIEEIVGTRRFLANAYVNSESSTDRANVFTNPLGGNVTIGNANVIAPDVFSNEESIYRLRMQPKVGTKINCIINTDIEEFLVVKDRGFIRNRIVYVGNIPQLLQTVVSENAGGATVNGYAKDDDGWFYVPGYSDVFRYRSGEVQAIIERPDKNDWLDTYRNDFANSDKENCTLFYLPELKAIYFLFGVNRGQATGYSGFQFVYFVNYGWRNIRLAEGSGMATTTFKWIAQLQSGHIVGITTHSPAQFKRLLWKYNVATAMYRLIYTDDGNGIVALLDTGELVIERGKDFLFTKCEFLKKLDQQMQGTLDCQIYLDGVLVHTYTPLNKDATYLILKSLSTDRKRGYTFRVVYNTNIDPEKLNTGQRFQIEGLLVYGQTVPHLRVNEAPVGGVFITDESYTDGTDLIQ